MKFRILHVLSGLIVFLCANQLFSQAIYFYEVFDDQFPVMRATYIARDGKGDSLAFPWDQWHLSENGESLDSRINIDCKKKPIPGTSVFFLLDYSTSMTEKIDELTGETKLDWMKYAVNAFLDSLKFVNNTQVAMGFFANGTKWSETNPPCVGFKTAPEDSLLRRAMDHAKIMGGKTDFSLAFFGTNMRPFLELANRPSTIQRHIIFITDGDPDALFTNVLQDSVCNLAKKYKTFIHVISIKASTNEGLRYVASRTGGAQAYVTTTKKDLKAQLQGLVNRVQSPYLCELRWTSNYTCDEPGRSREIVARRITTVDNIVYMDTTYQMPQRSVNEMNVTDSLLLFGATGSPQASNKFTLAHQGADYTVTGFKVEPFGEYIVTNWGGSNPPFQIKNGDSREITVAYNPEKLPTVSKKGKLTLNVTDYPCYIPDIVIVSLCGGVPTAELNFDATEYGQKSTQKMEFAFKNRTAVPVEVRTSIEGDNPGDFKIVEGNGPFLLNPAASLQLNIEFSPSDFGERKAFINYILPEDCGGTYKTNLSGIGIDTYVDEELVGPSVAGVQLRLVPNPATDNVNLSFDVSKSGLTRIEIYNTSGNKIETLLDKYLETGAYQSNYDSASLPNGIYFVRISSGGRDRKSVV